MAARAGEENVATLFGDIHYFYEPENARPRHHRFDKGSYVYLFENAHDRRCRIEIANQPGTDEQDAFDGFLDQTRVRYSYKQHCAVSLIVADSVDHNEWHLPTYDPRNDKKYHYKLHSLDIYFWTQNDALRFVNGVRRVLPSVQVEVLDEPGHQQTIGMSSVVQKLEKVAVSDPQYGNTTSSSSEIVSQELTVDPAPAASLDVLVNPLPPPPPPPASFAPMAYNPAAPAAPETIRHREKTPPPDEDPLNPLAVAVAHDYQKQPFTPGFPPQSQLSLGMASPGLPPNISNTSSLPLQFAGPPNQPGTQKAATMPANSVSAFSGLPVSPGFVPPPPPPQPSTQIPGHGTVAPPGGFSNYTYSHQSTLRQDGQDYSIHQQLYRPTEVEFGMNKPHQYQPKTETRGRLEENAGRLERGVSGMLKKFEKKFG
ncbi:RNA recognition motif-containing protein, partial [Metarhizium majus ARSEF 297]